MNSGWEIYRKSVIHAYDHCVCFPIFYYMMYGDDGKGFDKLELQSHRGLTWEM